ncbi:ANK [Mytilus edulis]|uniref:ANK n=1 Tax=Mytilus edulis TaxID=6550 RepID=A0A8S3QD81_MYTED|nr:ANK [Mytilus edulis]
MYFRASTQVGDITKRYQVPFRKQGEKYQFKKVSGVLEWTVTGKVTEYGQNVTLFCNVPNCCPKDAGWDRWTPVQQTLFIDIKTGRPNKKYDGKVMKDGYTLVIQNLTEHDLNVSYSCLHGVTFGERKLLLEEDVFKLSEDSRKIQSVSEDSCTIQSVSEDSCKIQPVSEDSCKIQPVSEDSCKIQSVSEDSCTIQSVLEDSCKIQSVSEDSCKIQPVSEDSCKIQSVSADSCTIQSVLEDSCKIQSVSEDSCKIQPVSEDSCKIQSVPEDSCKIQSVSEDSCKIQPVSEDSLSEDSCKIQSVSDYSCKIQPVSENSCKIQSVSEDSCKIQSVPEDSCKIQSVSEDSCKIQSVSEDSCKIQPVSEDSCKMQSVPVESCKIQSVLEDSCKIQSVSEDSCKDDDLELEVDLEDTQSETKEDSINIMKDHYDLKKKVLEMEMEINQKECMQMNIRDQIQRQIEDWEKKDKIQQLIQYLQQLDKLQQVKLANTKDTVEPKESCASGTTPLASICGHTDIVRLLLERNPDPCDNTSLSTSYVNNNISISNSPSLVQPLLKHKPDINAQTYDGGNALYFSAMNGNIEITQLLLENNADCNICIYSKQYITYTMNNNLRKTLGKETKELFDSLVKNTSSRVTEYVSKKSVDYAFDVIAGSSPLHIACFMGRINVVRCLLNHNADINMKKKMEQHHYFMHVN